MGGWNEASDVYQKSNWGGTDSFGLEKILHLWSWRRPGIPHTASFSLTRFLGWDVTCFCKGNFERALLRFLSLSFLPQSGAVECRRMSCPPVSCSPDSLPVHIAGQCCKVCRRKYWLRVWVVLCALRFFSPLIFRPLLMNTDQVKSLKLNYMYDQRSFYVLITCDVQILYIGFFSFLLLISTLITIPPILCGRNWCLKGLSLSTCPGSNNW